MDPLLLNMFPHKILAKVLWRDRLARLRAFRALQFKSGEKPIFDFINDLVQRTFLLDPLLFKNFVPIGYEAHAVTVFRQKLLRATLDHDLSAGVMMMKAGSQSSFLARLPYLWREELRKGGLNIHLLSRFLWAYVLLQKFREAVGQYRYLRKRRPYKKEGSYALLMGLPPRAYSGLEIEDCNAYSNFVQWFHERHPDLNLHIVTGNDSQDGLKPYAKFKAHMWPSLMDIQIYNVFERRAKKILVQALISLLRGHWYFLFIARDVIELEYMNLVHASDLPEYVALTNSHYIHRPLWSYNLEKRGKETGLYFYSTNTFNIDLTKGSYGLVYGYNLMSWSNYYTSTPQHAQFIEAATNYPKHIHVVGTIPLEDNGVALPVKRRKTLAYFDVQPFRDAFMAYIGRPSPLYFYESSLRNLEDLVSVCKKLNVDLAIKPKRHVGNRLCPRYRQLLEGLSSQGDVIIIDSYIAAERVAAWADMVVSQPFTSVAVAAERLGRPSIYYDALHLYKPKQLATQNIELLQDVRLLNEWVKEVANVSEAVA